MICIISCKKGTTLEIPTYKLSLVSFIIIKFDIGKSRLICFSREPVQMRLNVKMTQVNIDFCTFNDFFVVRLCIQALVVDPELFSPSQTVVRKLFLQLYIYLI